MGHGALLCWHKAPCLSEKSGITVWNLTIALLQVSLGYPESRSPSQNFTYFWHLVLWVCQWLFQLRVSKALLTFCFIQLSLLNLRLLHILCKCTLRALYFLHPSSYSKLSSSTPTRMSSRHTTYRNKSSFCFFTSWYACWLQYLYRTNHPHQSSGVLSRVCPFLL